VIFSQWLRMTELVERLLTANGIGYVHLNGSVPSRERKELMKRFREEPDCMVFLSTDAGGVGLNLQSGSVVINLDIPWNPAVLEQRIGRVHRMGQKKGVNVINFISRGSIEERILDLLKFKKSLFTGALDSDGDDVVMIGDSQMKRFMESVEAVTEELEKKEPALEREERLETELAERRADEEDSVAEEPVVGMTGTTPGEPLQNLLAAGARFLEALSQAVARPEAVGMEKPLAGQLNSMVGRDETTGKGFLKIPLPDPGALTNIFSAVGQLLATVTKKDL